MTHQCKFCNTFLTTENFLSKHQKTEKKCLIKQGVDFKGDFKCDLCEETFTLNSMLTTHKVSCSKKYNTELKKKNLLLESKLFELELNII